MRTQAEIIKEFCKIAKLDEQQFIDNGLKVEHSLDLINTKITELPKGLQVGGYLDLRNTQITSLPNNLQVGGWLDLEGTKITQLPEGLQVGGWLDLSYTSITSLPEGLQVGGGLYLNGTKITSLPNNLQVGGWLDLRNTLITEKDLPSNLKVGGNIYFDNKEIEREDLQPFISKCGKWIIVDGIKTEILSKKGNVMKVRKVASDKEFYLITDGNGKYAHGNTLEDAKEDLIYKVTNRNKSDYEGLNLESELSHEEAIVCYRVVTGACSYGTRDFIENRLSSNRKDKYTIGEVIKLTNGEYGNEQFKEFFS